jgi:hypothetical protein
MLVMAKPARRVSIQKYWSVHSQQLTIVVQEVLVSTVPDLGSDRAALVEVHTHALFLGTLTSEDVGRHGLVDLSLTKENLLLGFSLGGLDLDDLAARDHTDVEESDLDGVVGKDHTNKAGVEAAHTADVVLGSPGLDKRAHGSARVHAVGDGAGQVGVLGEDTRNVNGVVVARDASVGLVGGRCLENKRGLAVERNGVLEVHGLVERSTVAGQVVEDGVAEGSTGLVLDRCDLNDLLGGQLKLDLTDGLDRGEDSLVLVSVESLQPEDKGLAEKFNVRLLEAEPLLGLQDGDVLGSLQVDLHRGLNLALERVLEVGVGAAVQELGGDLHDGSAITGDGAANLDQLARGLVDDSIDLGGGVKDVTLLQRGRTRKHAEAVGKVDKLEKITVDLAREDRLGDSLPANNDGEVHGSEDLLARPVNEGLASVSNGVDEVVDGLAGDGGAATLEARSNRGIEGACLITEPNAVVELLDAVVASVHHLADRSVTSLGVVSEPQGQSLGLARGGALINHLDADLVVRDGANLDRGHVLAVRRLLDGNDSTLGVIRVSNLDKHARSR